jgi:hypothetical protein
LWQATDFADHVVSGALTAEFAAEVERLRAQHADAVREKSAAESKSRRLTERLAAMEVEKGDLRRQLVEERREANKAIADAQAAQAEAKLARAKGSLARQRAEELERGSTSYATTWTKPRPRRARRSSGRMRSSWTRTGSWVRGPPPSKRLAKRWASASWSGYRRSWGAPDNRDGPHVLCLHRHLRGGRECFVPRGVRAFRGLRPIGRKLRTRNLLGRGPSAEAVGGGALRQDVGPARPRDGSGEVRPGN